MTEEITKRLISYMRHSRGCKIYDPTAYAPQCSCGMDYVLSEFRKALQKEASDA